MPKGGDRILGDANKQKDVKKMAADEKKVELVIFLLLEDYYAFIGSDIKEILSVGSITYVPGSPDFILGIINVRGDIESVFDIHKFLGLPDVKIVRKSRIAIADKDGVRSAILIDSVKDVIDVPANSIKPPISTLDKSIQEFVVGETTYNKKNVTVFDVGKIFGKLTG